MQHATELKLHDVRTMSGGMRRYHTSPRSVSRATEWTEGRVFKKRKPKELGLGASVLYTEPEGHL